MVNAVALLLLLMLSCHRPVASKYDFVNPWQQSKLRSKTFSCNSDAADFAMVGFESVSTGKTPATGIQKRIVHPSYNAATNAFDVMLVKLAGVSSNPFVTLNVDDAIPSAQDEVLDAIGFGTASVLHTTSVSYLPNDICEQVEFPALNKSLAGLITPDMMCASSSLGGTCDNDNGAPLIKRGASFYEDVQIGLVSWYVENGSQSNL